MRRVLDLLRLLVLSPELFAVLACLIIQIYVPDWLNAVAKAMKDGLTFGLSGAGIALTALAFCYRQGDDILSPQGRLSVLLEWPDYFMLKARVIAALTWCVAGIGASLVATWMVASGRAAQWASMILVAGVLVASISVATTALARYRIRELFGTK